MNARFLPIQVMVLLRPLHLVLSYEDGGEQVIDRIDLGISMIPSSQRIVGKINLSE